MGDFQIKVQPKVYDVVIVGAGGGMAAYTMANEGLKVAVVEAGPDYNHAKNATQLKSSCELWRRGAVTRYRPFGDFDSSYLGWAIDGEPFTQASGTEWHWWPWTILALSKRASELTNASVLASLFNLSTKTAYSFAKCSIE